jgi:hypothetical protein
MDWVHKGCIFEIKSDPYNRGEKMGFFSIFLSLLVDTSLLHLSLSWLCRSPSLSLRFASHPEEMKRETPDRLFFLVLAGPSLISRSFISFQFFWGYTWLLWLVRTTSSFWGYVSLKWWILSRYAFWCQFNQWLTQFSPYIWFAFHPFWLNG